MICTWHQRVRQLLHSWYQCRYYITSWCIVLNSIHTNISARYTHVARCSASDRDRLLHSLGNWTVANHSTVWRLISTATSATDFADVCCIVHNALSVLHGQSLHCIQLQLYNLQSIHHGHNIRFFGRIFWQSVQLHCTKSATQQFPFSIQVTHYAYYVREVRFVCISYVSRNPTSFRG